MLYRDKKVVGVFVHFSLRFIIAVATYTTTYTSIPVKATIDVSKPIGTNQSI
jgi:hypothetical protein